MSLPAGGAINTNPADCTASHTPIPLSARILAKLQDQYMQGKHCDMRIRCIWTPEHKTEEQEQKNDENDKEETGNADESPALPFLPHQPQTRTTDILCHANVLTARSPNFESSLNSGWNEAQAKMVQIEVEVENEQEVQDMKLLVKLCYSDSYIHDGGLQLDRSTRIRLALLGDWFEMQDCVSECLASLKEGLTVMDAVTILHDVPEELRRHEAMTGLAEKVIDVLEASIDAWTQSDPPKASEECLKFQIATALATALELICHEWTPSAPRTDSQKAQLQTVGDALAKALGPVDQLFGESGWVNSLECHYFAFLPLKPHVSALFPSAMEALLASDALHVKTENEAYTLLGSWLYQSPHAGAFDGIHPVSVTNCIPLFHRFVKFVRLQHLSLEYVANVVIECPLANHSGLLPSMLRSSLATRETDTELLVKDRGVDYVPFNRGRGNLEWTCTSTLQLADVLPLGKETMLINCAGLADGYPMLICVFRNFLQETNKETESEFDIFLDLMMSGKVSEDDHSRCASLQARIQAGAHESSWKACLFNGHNFLSPDDAFKPWEEVVHEKSKYFPTGQMTVKVETRLLEKGRRSLGQCKSSK